MHIGKCFFYNDGLGGKQYRSNESDNQAEEGFVSGDGGVNVGIL
jgi:hypothetical protein